jgi:hypothetical protein
MKKVFPTRIEELRGTKTQKEFAACAVKDARIDKLLAIIDTLAKGGSASGSPSAHSETA